MDNHIVCVSGIYAITNTVNGKKYIGSALNIKQRFGQHAALLKRNVHHSAKLQRSWVKHGSEAFSFSVVECVPNRLDLIAREQVWIDHFMASTTSGYNMRPTAESGLGTKQTAEHIAKRCAYHVGVKRSLETGEKIRQAALGRKQSAESIEKRVSQFRGRKQTAEHIEKASIARMGWKNTPETIERMRRKALNMTAETKAKMSAWQIGRKLTPESIAKRTATQKANRLAKTLLAT